MMYLITGGAGFIGSNLTDELIKQGHRVKIIDNLSTGKKENLNPAAIFCNLDISNLQEGEDIFKNVDGVFHMAALPNVQYSIENPEETHKINVEGTLNTLLFAKKAGVKKVVFSASSAAYGDSTMLPLTEKMPTNPKSPYGLHKLIGEKYCKLFSEIYNLETVSLRYFNVYGKRMADTGAYFTVISVFLKQKALHKPLTIVGDGLQTRDFVHVSDVVRANILAMENNMVGHGEVINIGSGKNYNVNYIASLIGGTTENIPPRVEPRDTLADIKKARELLGWVPTVTLENGIQELKITSNLS